MQPILETDLGIQLEGWFVERRNVAPLEVDRDADPRAARHLTAAAAPVEKVARPPAANRRLDAGHQRQQRLLAEIRDDTARREGALTELRTASDGLTALVNGLDPTLADTSLDMSKFQGLLDWPADGVVRSGFGSVIHPRFKTKVPHPGIDILAESGKPIHSVFDGEVVFSGWLRGYGLTTIVDHGRGLHCLAPERGAEAREQGHIFEPLGDLAFAALLGPTYPQTASN